MTHLHPYCFDWGSYRAIGATSPISPIVLLVLLVLCTSALLFTSLTSMSLRPDTLQL